MPNPDVAHIYAQLSLIISAYSPPLHIRMRTATGIDLWAEGNFECMGKPCTEMFFASAISQSSHVGFYLMPIYSGVESIKKTIPPRVQAMSQGKGCYYIDEWDNGLAHDIRTALKNGFAIYKARGWV